jgi:hypothetical protein
VDLPQGLSLSIEDRSAAADRKARNNASTEFNRPFLRDPGFGWWRCRRYRDILLWIS